MQKLSNYFLKTSREDPSNEQSTNAKLLIRAGYIYKEMAGVYAFLPIGLIVLEKIKEIVRLEMNKLGGQELIMTSLQRQEVWEKTDRWDDEKVDIWFKTKLKNDTQLGLAWSHEEQITQMMKSYISSYRDLPINVYQFQNKLRNEVRSKSGIMRCREFLMKDMYSYSKSKEEHEEFYNKVIKAYLNIFKQLGLEDTTYLTFASGGAFTQFSHEFQTICEAGEDIIYIDDDKKIAINEEVLNDEVIKQLDVSKEKLTKVKAAEVGNIFNFGTEKSEQMELSFSSEDGVAKSVVLGSYGIGITRLMGVIVEKFHDDKGIIWPRAIAPYDIILLDLLKNDDKIISQVVDVLEKLGLSVLLNDRDISAGEKLADADLIGIPNRIVVSKKSLELGGVSVKKRDRDGEENISIDHLSNYSWK
jgi:prolyl-tRNA synthetase